MNNMKRRDFLKTIGAGTLVLTLPKFLTSCASETKRPNIMFCIADDWGWPHAGVYGDSVVKTPMFDRIDKGAFGWRQDDIFMTYLGLTDQAKENLVTRSKNYDKNSCFPAFWGPNYDWTPDQDHGGVLMKTFQSMLIQTDPYSKKIYLMPAWPKEWDCEFKLNAPYKTTIEGDVINGVLCNNLYIDSYNHIYCTINRQNCSTNQ